MHPGVTGGGGGRRLDPRGNESWPCDVIYYRRSVGWRRSFAHYEELTTGCRSHKLQQGCLYVGCDSPPRGWIFIDVIYIYLYIYTLVFTASSICGVLELINDLVLLCEQQQYIRPLEAPGGHGRPCSCP